MIKIDAARRDPPQSAMVRCDESLATMAVTKDIWEGLDGQAQINAIVNYVVSQWSGPYHRCALRHNELVTFNEGPP